MWNKLISMKPCELFMFYLHKCTRASLFSFFIPLMISWKEKKHLHAEKCITIKTVEMFVNINQILLYISSSYKLLWYSHIMKQSIISLISTTPQFISIHFLIFYYLFLTENGWKCLKLLKIYDNGFTYLKCQEIVEKVW